MLISYYANKQRFPRLPSWQPSLIFFNVPIESGSIIKPCTLKHFQVTCRLHKAGYWTIVAHLSQNCHGIHESLQWRHNECDGVSNHQPHAVYASLYSGADQRKHQSSASLAFVRGIRRWQVSSPHKGLVTRKMFPFDDIIMVISISLLASSWMQDSYNVFKNF